MLGRGRPSQSIPLSPSRPSMLVGTKLQMKPARSCIESARPIMNHGMGRLDLAQPSAEVVFSVRAAFYA
jgi:hypothetical protein